MIVVDGSPLRATSSTMPSAKPTKGAHGVRISDDGSDLYRALKDKAQQPFDGDSLGEVEDFCPNTPDQIAFEPPPDVAVGGHTLKAVVPAMPAGVHAPIVISKTKRTAARAAKASTNILPMQPAPDGAHASLADLVNLTFITDIGPFECRCVSAIITDDIWLTLLGNGLPKIEEGRRFRIVVDGTPYHLFSPGISVDLELGPYKIRVAHYAIVADEKPVS